jgi:hypothetical protein
LALGIGINTIYLYDYILGEQISPLFSDGYRRGYYKDIYIEEESETFIANYFQFTSSALLRF